MKGGKKIKKEAIIFPRYHQLDTIEKLLQAARTEGPGHNSRLPAVRYKLAFDKNLKKKGNTALQALVAFSGKVKDGALEYTEAGLNGFGERELPGKFEGPEYHFLIVAKPSSTSSVN